MPRVRAPLLAATMLLAAARVAADPSPEEQLLTLASLRARYAAALDAEGFRGDHPRVRAVADEVTAELLPMTSPGALGDQSRAVLHDAAGAALGPWLAQPEHHHDPLLGPWLREHDDPDAARLASTLEPRLAVRVAAEVVVRRPALAASLLRDAPAAGVRDEACAVARALPLRERVVAAGSLTRDVDDPVDCLALAASVPAPRARLVLAVRRTLARERPVLHWLRAAFAVFDALSLSDRAALRAALRAASALTRDMLVEELAALGPSLPAGAPGFRDALADASPPGARADLLPVELRALSLHPWSPSPLTRIAALQAAGLAVPRGAESSASLALTRARARLAAWGRQHLTASFDAWIDALDQTARCRDDACLGALVASGSEASGARAAWLLGARGLASPEVASSLVRRAQLDRALPSRPGVGASLVTTVAFALLTGCPPTLRGLAWGAAPRPDVASRWQVAFATRCHEEAPR